MDTKNRIPEKEAPVRVIRIAPPLRLTFGLLSVLGVAFFCVMAGLAVLEWVEDGDPSGNILTAIIVMPFFAALALYPGIYAFLAQVRLYRDRLVVWEPPFRKQKYFRDISHLGLYRNEHERSLLIFDGKRTLELQIGKFTLADLENVHEFIRDAHRDLGHGELKWLSRPVLEDWRKKRNRRLIVGLAIAGLLLLSISLFG